MNDVMSFSTSQFSSESRIFSHDWILSAGTREPSDRKLTASSLTHTVDATFAKVHKLLLVKSMRSSSRSWNFCAFCQLGLVSLLRGTNITSEFPVSVPAACRLFQALHCSLIFIACGSHLNLGFLEFRFVLSLFLAHNHVTLRQITLYP